MNIYGKMQNKEEVYMPMEVVKISSLSLPLILNLYTTSNQLSFFGGVHFSILTSMKAGLFKFATEKAPTIFDSFLCGLKATNDCYDNERSLNAGEMEKVDTDKGIDILGVTIPLRKAQVSWLVGFNYESTYGTIWGIKYERAITSFIDYQNENLNEVGNWTLVMELGYNFARIL